MHLAQRAYVLILLTAVLGVAGVWSSEPEFSNLWRVPAAMLLIGLAFEASVTRRVGVDATVETAARAFLGREQPAAFAFHNGSSRPLTIEYAPSAPEGIEALGTAVRRISAPAGAVARDGFTVFPVRLGPQVWPAMPARVRGALGLSWWSREFRPAPKITVAPDTFQAFRGRPRGNPAGARPRRLVGAGSELHQLRRYVQGDPPARIDWKATARQRALVTREFSEDQHLDILVAIDAGRFSRIRAGRLDRFGLYANVTARFAEVVVPNDDRIGLLVFAERTLAACTPDRGLPAVMRIRKALEAIATDSGESDPLAAAIRIRSMLKHRGLIVLLTDLDDANVAGQLARAVRLLSPPHLVVVAGIRSTEISELASRNARNWQDPWIALAAKEHQRRARRQLATLKSLGAPVIAADAELLERAVLAEYESLRRSHRV